MKVSKEQFDKVLGNLLHQPPLKRADAKPDAKKKTADDSKPTVKPESDQQ